LKEFREIAGERSFAVPRFTLGEGAGRQEYSLIDSYCDDPQCIGTEISIRLRPERTSDPSVPFAVNIFEKQVEFDREPGEEIRKLAREFTVAHIALLMRRRQVVRAWALGAGGRIGDYEPGRMYGFVDFGHPSGFTIPFEHRGRNLGALDFYCVNPDCSCADTEIQFFSESEEDLSLEFQAVLDLHSGELRSPDHAPLPETARVIVSSLEESLGDWRAEMSLRKDLLLRIARRRLRFPSSGTAAAGGEGAGGLIALPGTPLPGAKPFQPTARGDGPRPGRNDPCPCGSGKKYKKCCGR
jgi:hypothetical protein